MEKKKNPDYTASAVNLTNPPEIEGKLAALEICQLAMVQLEDEIKQTEAAKQLASLQAAAAELTAQIKGMIDAMGSFQDVVSGRYAVKQRRETISYQPQMVRAVLNEKLASLVIVEAVDAKALDGLLKGKLITPEQARECGEAKETFAFIVRT